MNIAPYEPNNIYCGPSETMLAALPDECIDLTVTSPPYDNLRTYNGYTFDFFAIARQLIRVTKRGGVIVWVVADQTINGSETGTSFKQALYFMAKGMRLHDTMIYEQAGTGAKGSNLAYWQGFEYMFVFSKGKPSTTNLIVDKPNRFKGSVVGSSPKMDALGSRRERGPRTVPEYSKRTNIWRIHPSNGNNTEHPAPFPETLARDHIISNISELCEMTESKIRTLLFSIGSTAIWLLLAYLVSFHEPDMGEIVGLVLIALLLLIAAMGQGDK